MESRKIAIDYDHQGNRIKNVPTPIDVTDASNKAFVISYVAQNLGGGPPGPAGPTGPVSGAYTHNQNVPSSVWTINHNLNYIPAGILVLDSAGTQWFGNIISRTTTQLIIDFGVSFSGTADLS